jgi:broad specificity phosphatase PhoE
MLETEKDKQQPQARPEEAYLPGELTPAWSSPYPYADLTEPEKAAIKHLTDLVGQKDVAARRWEVEQSWEARLFARGYQYLLPRKGGGWILPPFATDYNRPNAQNQGLKWYGYETNIYTTYLEIVTAALTRDIPSVRFEPSCPDNDSDIIAADAASQYARVFARNNDLLQLQHQLAWYLCTDGRAVIVTDYIQDASRFGREEPDSPRDLVPEVPYQPPQAQVYLVRHGQTSMNAEGMARGRAPVPEDAKGVRETNMDAEFLKDKGIQIIFCSPVPRAFEAAQRIAQAIGAPVDVDERFASLNIGELAGKQNAREEVAQHFKTGLPFPGGESPESFKSRVQQGIIMALQAGAPVAIVTHDSVISEVGKLLTGDDFPIGEIDTGGIAGVFTKEDGTYEVYQVHPFQRPAIKPLVQRPKPSGAEVAQVFGKLEAKTPINAMTIEDFPYLQVCREYDIAYVKAMFPQHAEKIQPGGATTGENELDRIARINAALGLEASYVTGDSMVRDCTIQRTWIRPSFFMEIKDAAIRKSILDKFPDGAHVVVAGSCFIGARNESMDDHCTLVQAYPGSGQNRIAIMSKVISIQKRLNNWLDLLNDYFIRTVPARYINSDIFNVEALKTQANRPGPYIPFSLRNTPEITSPDQMVWVEQAPTHQPSMPEFIQTFLGDLPQLLSGALPSLFGARSNNEGSSRDTATGVAMQRDQALGRLGTPWHAIQMATCSYFKQAVRLAALCRGKDIVSFDKNGAQVRIALVDLKGNIMAYPEQSTNFPESWNQKQTRAQQLLAEAGTNPYMQQLLSQPGNLKMVRDLAGFPQLHLPPADAYEKQQGEFEALLKGAPMPNPAKQQAIEQAHQAQQDLESISSLGVKPSPDQVAQVQQLAQQAQSIPDLVSSVPVDPDTDLHEIEAQACKDFINSPAGRKLRYGSQAEQEQLLNVKLHMKEHLQFVNPAGKTDKPPTFTVNYKDMPPEAAAKLLQEQGLETTPAGVAQNRMDTELMKKLGKENPRGE